jgi:dihydrodipicolinate synthase/N-acetylneuraminate lyase
MQAPRAPFVGVKGVVPVIPTPFDDDEAVDEVALRGLIDFTVSCGVWAICLPAFGSEFYKLSDQERMEVVRIAANQAAGRLLVIAQSNHTSSRVALSTARRNVAAGANLISVAIPRLFALSDDDLFRYLVPILNAVDVPVVVQDFNPGGPTISSGFVVRLLAQCPNLRYLKLWASQREHSAYSARYCLISCSHCRMLNCISIQRSAFCKREGCCGARIAEEQATLPTCPPISM